MTAVSTADRIADVALRLFTVRGYASVSMEEIRRTAGVSNGSLYHHYASRADLAARLLLDGMADSQLVILQAVSGDAEEGVCGAVRAQLGWVEEHADLARLLYSDLPDDVLLAAEPTFSRHNARYVKVAGRWLQDHAERGGLIARPFIVTHALWLGPTQEFARHWLRGRSRLKPTQAAPDLAQGAWRALAAT
jgi:AcrR family transcriptional regulator